MMVLTVQLEIFGCLLFQSEVLFADSTRLRFGSGPEHGIESRCLTGRTEGAALPGYCLWGRLIERELAICRDANRIEGRSRLVGSVRLAEFNGR